MVGWWVGKVVGFWGCGIVGLWVEAGALEGSILLAAVVHSKHEKRHLVDPMRRAGSEDYYAL